MKISIWHYRNLILRNFYIQLETSQCVLFMLLQYSSTIFYVLFAHDVLYPPLKTYVGGYLYI